MHLYMHLQAGSDEKMRGEKPRQQVRSPQGALAWLEVAIIAVTSWIMSACLHERLSATAMTGEMLFLAMQ
jgi:hypothetical protein